MRRFLWSLIWMFTLGTAASGRIISLGQAYDIASKSDQSVGIAALNRNKTELEPLTALTPMGPKTPSHPRLYATSSIANRTRA